MLAATAPATAQTAPADAPALARALLEREEGALRRVIGRYLRHPSDADDAFQELSLRVMRFAHTVREPAAVRGWVYQTARSACLDLLRRERRRPTAPDGAAEQLFARGEQAREPGDDVLTAERIAAVRRALDQLPASQRETLRLFAEEGLDHTAIAERLALKRNAVEVRLCRARTALRERLADIFGGDL